MEELKQPVNDDIEVLNVNKDLIVNEKTNGFKIEKSKVLMVLKKLPVNIYRLTVLLLATIADKVPEFISKVPVIGYGVDALRALATQYTTQAGSDYFFKTFFCPYMGVAVAPEGQLPSYEYLQLYHEFTNVEGAYFHISLAVKTVAQFALEHPALILAGGAALGDLVYKLIKYLIKKLDRKVTYKLLNDKQKRLFELLKEILNKSRRLKKSENGKILVRDLNITYDIVSNLAEYPNMLDKIYDILLRLEKAVEKNDLKAFEQCRIELESGVFLFEKENNNYLNKEMRLVEDTKKTDKKQKK